MGEYLTPEGEVLNGGEYKVTLGGKEYVWKEPNRRALRRMMIDICRMTEGRKLAGTIQEGEQASNADALAFIEDGLDFFLKWHPAMKADAAHVENSDTQEISLAIGGLTTFLTLPFVREQAKTAAKLADTMKAEPTN